MTKSRNADVVVVTGASAGVGRATVRAFARKGAHIGLLARDRDRLEAARKEVEAAGGRALAIPTDVADPAQVEAAAEAVEREFGPIDIWSNVAMTTIFAPLAEISPQDFKRATEVTYLGVVYGTQAALKRMLPRDRGVIVQTGSALAYRSIPLQSPYCGAKHAVVGFTDSLRSELIHNNSSIHLTMVHLPGLNTPQFDWCKTMLPNHPQPVPPIYQPEVAADAIVWAAYHRRREVFVGSPTLKAVWGQKFIPGWLDRYLAFHAWDEQQTDQPVDPNRPSNLWSPVPGNFGARGRFTERAGGFSPQWWLSRNRQWLAAAGAAALGAALASLMLHRPSELESRAKRIDERWIPELEPSYREY